MKRLGRRQFLHLTASAAALPALSRIARAQAYPSRPITMVVAFAAGGAQDVVARILAEPMRASLGQPVIIENVAGANGTIGVGRIARAPPDGYTLGIGSWSTHVANGAAYALPYDVLNDFEPVSLLVDGPLLITAKKTIPAGNLQEFIAWLRANPGKAAQGHSGLGGMAHVAGLLLQKETGTSFQSVPYRGGAPAVQDLLAGHIDFTMGPASDTLPQIRLGSIKAFAVAAKRRLAAAPNIPTVDEAGLPGLHLSVWVGLWVPKRTPKDIIVKLNAAVVDALAEPTARQRLGELAQEIFPRDQQTPQALGTLQKAEIEKWWPIIKAANIKGE
jgi:tripartite-type tricarboxylate transporter receptor subunit TctC